MCHIGLAHQVRNPVAEEGDDDKENGGGKRGDAPCRGKKPAFGGLHVAARLLGFGRETEIARLHTHRQQRERQRDQGVDIRDDAIGLLPENTGIVRREQIAQEPYGNGTDTVDGSLFCKFFEHGHSL